jgi:hypothetical protein
LHFTTPPEHPLSLCAIHGSSGEALGVGDTDNRGKYTTYNSTTELDTEAFADLKCPSRVAKATQYYTYT